MAKPTLEEIFGTQPKRQSLDEIFGGETETFTPKPVPESEPIQSAPVEPSKPGFFDRIQGHLQKRAEQTNQAVDKYNTGQMGAARTGLRRVGAATGAMNDVLGEAGSAVAAGLAPFVPESVKKTLGAVGKYGGEYLADTDLAKKAVEWAKENPNAAQDLTDIANIAGAGTALAPFASRAIAAKPNMRGALTLDTLDADQTTLDAVRPIKDRFAADKAREGAAWRAAEAVGDTTKIHGDKLAPKIYGDIEQALTNEGLSLEMDNLRAVKDVVSRLSKFEAKPDKVITYKTDPFSPLPQPKDRIIPYGGVPVNEIIGMRKSLSRMAGKSTDADVRVAAGKALEQMTKSLEDAVKTAVMSGDQKAIEKYMKAINTSRENFLRYGTNTRSGQNSVFEKIITKNAVDNSQIIDALGTTARGKSGSGQMITRLLDNAGGQRDVVRKNLADGFVYRAIKRASDTIEGGEIIIKPSRLRTEIDRIINEDRAVGGMGKDIRNQLFPPEEIKRLKALRDSLKDAKSLTGSVIEYAAGKVPLAGGMISKRLINTGRKNARITEKWLNQDLIKAMQALRGKPMSYAPFYGAVAADAALKEPVE